MATEEQITREQKIDVIVSAAISGTIITGLAVGFLILQHKHNRRVEGYYSDYLKGLIEVDRENLSRVFDKIFEGK